jgi:hypothetical protein
MQLLYKVNLAVEDENELIETGIHQKIKDILEDEKIKDVVLNWDVQARMISNIQILPEDQKKVQE